MTVSSKELFSRTTRAVSSFVMLAGGEAWWIFCPKMTAPELKSITMPPSAMIPMSEGQSGLARAVPAHPILRPAASSRPAIFFSIPFMLKSPKCFVTVQDGGKAGAKTGVKLAYQRTFAPVITSDEAPS